MDHYQLLEHARFSDSPTGNAVALHKNKYGRVMVFALRDGQALPEHKAPAPVTIVVLQGQGLFLGRDGADVQVTAPGLVTLNPGEAHGVKTNGSDLVFAVILGNPAPADPGPADTGSSEESVGAEQTPRIKPTYQPDRPPTPPGAPAESKPDTGPVTDPPTDPIGE